MSKKKRRRRRHSSAREREKKALPKQDDTRDHKNVETKHVEVCQQSPNKRDDSVPPSIKNDSQGARKIKKPVYRLAKLQATEHRTVDEKASSSKTKSACAPVHAGEGSSSAWNFLSAERKTISGSSTVETNPSKRTRTASPAFQTTKKSKQKSQRESGNLNSEQKDRKHHEQGKRGTAEVPWKTWESLLSSSMDDAKLRRDAAFGKNPQPHQTKELGAETSSCATKKHLFSSSTRMPSTVVKHTASKSGSKWLKEDTPVSGFIKSQPQKPLSILKRTYPPISSTPIRFKIPKRIGQSTVQGKTDNNEAVSTITNHKHDSKLSNSGVTMTNSFRKNVEEAHSSVNAPPYHLFEVHNARVSASSEFPATTATESKPCCDQMHVVLHLHAARSQRRLEVNLTESYGELTCMDIDPPEEEPAPAQDNQPAQRDLIVVLDTNILLSHLSYVKKIHSMGFKGLGSPLILIPWVVLQELDCLKKRRDVSSSVAYLAIPAISYIHNTLKSQKPGLWGQSMQQAAACGNNLNAENNDDRVLQCCLQYQSLYPEYALILCTDDKNLCTKSVLSGVTALSKIDLEKEDERSRDDAHVQQHSQCVVPLRVITQVSSPVVRRSFTQVQLRVQESAGPSAPLVQEKDKQQPGEANKEKDPSSCIFELKECLHDVLSDILEVEMKAIYEDLWTEIVYRKPPWTLEDVLHCFKKHWIAVFGDIVPRALLQTVTHLINFFKAGDTADVFTISEAFLQARKLVKAFQKRSRHFARAMSVMDKIFKELNQPHQPAERSSAFDVVMNESDNEEAKQSSTPQLSHQEVWAMFESIWSTVFQTSLEVFKAVGFDPQTMQSAQPAGGGEPPQDAVACLHRLFSMVSQLLQAFSSVLSLGPDMKNVQTVIDIIHSYKIVGEDSRVTAEDLLVCFLQPDYREKLQFGATQLMELHEALNRCIHSSRVQTFST